MSNRPKLVDLFCGAGGCSMGYHRAGFDVVGVDVMPQPRYPFQFVRADAMTYPLDGFDVIHASPPCQKYSQICRAMKISDGRPDLIARTRDRLANSGAEWVIENVIGAPMFCCVVLCGSMFGLRTKSGLWLRRHRLFECSRLLFGVPYCRHESGPSIGVYGNGMNAFHREKLGRNITTDEQREAMGIDWMPRSSLTQAIPPAYTEWIGRQLLPIVSARQRECAAAEPSI